MMRQERSGLKAPACCGVDSLGLTPLCVAATAMSEVGQDASFRSEGYANSLTLAGDSEMRTKYR